MTTSQYDGSTVTISADILEALRLKAARYDVLKDRTSLLLSFTFAYLDGDCGGEDLIRQLRAMRKLLAASVKEGL
jgi:hypothetical protein